MFAHLKGYAMKFHEPNLYIKLFKLFAVGIFLYQIHHSILKYYNKPVVKQSVTKSLHNAETPAVYVCEVGQFNYSQAEKFGYGGTTKFAIGLLMEKDRNLTWMGQFGNLTFQQLQELIYDYDYSNLEVKSSQTGDKWDWEKNEPYEVFLSPFGFCMKLGDIEQYTEIKLTRRSLIIFVDPKKESSIFCQE